MRHRSVTYTSARTSPGNFADVFQALADPTRRAMLDLLRRGSQPAGHIAHAFPVSRPAISKHLRLLRRAHLVREHREGRNRIYDLHPEPLRAVDSWIEHYRRFWSTRLSKEAEHARKMQGSRKREATK
jgi:DNA-binding transcriptional ArsR family regulator